MKNNFKIVALALHASILMYGFVLFILSQNAGGEWTLAWRVLPENQILTVLMAALSLMATSLAIFLKPLMVRMALAESVAIYGFVAAFLNHSLLLMAPFALWALILQIFVGPWIQKTE